MRLTTATRQPTLFPYTPLFRSNDYIRYTERPSAPTPPDYPLPYDSTKKLQQAVKNHPTQDHSFDCGSYWAGTRVHEARHLPARQLMQLLTRELRAASQ